MDILAPARSLAAVVAVAAQLVTAVPLIDPPVNPYQRGPDPTVGSLSAVAGPYAIAETVVAPAAVTGFGGAGIYYPVSTADGTFGGVVVAPGFRAPRVTLEWIARRVASHGFVVINIDTLDPSDVPLKRAAEMQSALAYLTGTSTVRDRVDPARLAVMGHSMGGGGALSASVRRPDLKAAVPLTPWASDDTYTTDQVPTLIFGADQDTTAPPAEYAEPFYESIAAPHKAYLELRDADHRAPIHVNPDIGEFTVAWLKRWVDDDLRYAPFLCPPPVVSDAIAEYRSTCDAGG